MISSKSLDYAFTILFCVCLLNSCASTEFKTNKIGTAIPHDLIKETEQNPQLFTAIYQIHHQGQFYYWRIPGCCDRFSELYDQQGQKICAPNGGFTGMGDRKCGDIDVRTLPKTKIWPKTPA